MKVRYLIIPLALVLAVLAVATSFGAPADYPGGLTLYYQTIINNGTRLFQRPILTLNGGFTCADDKANGRTVCALTAPTASATPTRTATSAPTSTPAAPTPTGTPTVLPTIAPPSTPVPGAPAFEDSATSQGNGTCTTFPVAATAPSLALLDVLLHSNSVTVSGTPTYGGMNMTLVSGPINGGATASSYLYKLQLPPSGTQSVVICFSGVVNYVVGASTYTSAYVSGSAVTDTAGSPSVTVSSASGHLVHDSLSMSISALGAPNPVAGSGQTQRFNLMQAPSYFGASSDKAGSASTTLTWSSAFPYNTFVFSQIGIDLAVPTATPTATPTSTPTPTPTP